MNVGNYTQSINQAIPATQGFTTAARTAGMALKLMLGPVGLIIAAVGSMVAYFKRSEEGQNTWAAALKVGEVILNNFLDVVGSVGEFLVNAFLKPKQTLEQFTGWIKSVGDFFSNTFGNVIGGSIDVFVAWIQKAFAKVGVAWEKVKDVFVDNADGINEAQSKVNEKNAEIEAGQERVKKGVENLKDAALDTYESARKAVADFNSETQKEIALTIELQKQKAALDKLNREYLIADAKAQREIAELREVAAQKEEVDAETRMSALNRALELQDEIMSRELNMARQRAEIHKQEIAMSESTKEDLDEQARLQAEIINIETRNAGKRRRFQSERVTALREISKEQIQVLNREIEAWQQTNQTKIEQDKKLTEELIKNEDNRLQTLRDKQNEALRMQFESELITQAEYNEKKLANDEAYLTQKQELETSFKAQELERAQMEHEAQMEIAQGNMFAELELERQGLEMKYEQELETAKKIGADTTIIDEKFAKARKQISQSEQDAKLMLAQGFTQNLATIFGEQTKLGKAAAVASTTIETYKSAQSAFAALAPIPIVGPALGGVAAGAAIAAGIANVRKILAVNPSGGGSTPSPTSVSTPNVSTSQTGATSTQVDTEIGRGIVSRNDSERQKSEAVLVVDDVTNAQRSNELKENVSTL
jgi:hypothetical protein